MAENRFKKYLTAQKEQEKAAIRATSAKPRGEGILQTADDLVRAAANTVSGGMIDKIAGAMPAWLGGEADPAAASAVARSESPYASVVGDIAGTIPLAMGASGLVAKGIPALAGSTVPRIVAREGIAGTGLSTVQQGLTEGEIDPAQSGLSGLLSAGVPAALGMKARTLKGAGSLIESLFGRGGGEAAEAAARIEPTLPMPGPISKPAPKAPIPEPPIPEEALVHKPAAKLPDINLPIVPGWPVQEAPGILSMAAPKKPTLPSLPPPKPIPSGEAARVGTEPTRKTLSIPKKPPEPVAVPEKPPAALDKPKATAAQKAEAQKKGAAKAKKIDDEIADAAPKRSKAPGVSAPKTEAPKPSGPSKEELKKIYQKKLDEEALAAKDKARAEIIEKQEAAAAKKAKDAAEKQAAVEAAGKVRTPEGVKKTVADKFKDEPSAPKRSRAPGKSPDEKLEAEFKKQMNEMDERAPIGRQTKSATTGKLRGGNPRRVPREPRSPKQKQQSYVQQKYNAILKSYDKYASPLITGLGTTLSSKLTDPERRRRR